MNSLTLSDFPTIVRTAVVDGKLREAVYSECMDYRYSLKIVWDEALPVQVFIGLNPSTATELEDDPTLRKVQGFARRWGCGGIVMLNACAYRATDPKEMLKQADPIGLFNQVHHLNAICDFYKRTPIAAWGGNIWKVRDHMGILGGWQKVLFTDLGHLDCLGVNADGTPQHPLYIPYQRPRKPYNYQEPIDQPRPKRINPPIPASIINNCHQCQFSSHTTGSRNVELLHCSKLSRCISDWGGIEPIPEDCPLERA